MLISIVRDRIVTIGLIAVLITIDNELKYNLIGLLHFRPEEGIASFDAYDNFDSSTPMRLHFSETSRRLI